MRMTSLGRGRGRVAYTAPLRRPGQPVHAPDYIVSMNALVSVVDDQTENMLDYIEKQVIAACSSITATQEVVDTIYNISIRDRNFGKVGGAVLARLTGTELEGFRKAVLNRLQTDYEERENMKADNGSKLVNFVCLLGAIYHKTILRTGLPLRVLATPLVTCLGMILGRSLPKIEIFTEQIVLNGEKLLEHAPDGLTQLMVRVRELLVGQPPLENGGTTYILLCIELEAHKFTSLPSHVISFYESTIVSREMSSLLERLKPIS